MKANTFPFYKPFELALQVLQLKHPESGTLGITLTIGKRTLWLSTIKTKRDNKTLKMELLLMQFRLENQHGQDSTHPTPIPTGPEASRLPPKL